jgi:hypothetical protein
MLLGCVFGCLGRFTLYPAPLRIAGLFLRTLVKGHVRDQRITVSVRVRLESSVPIVKAHRSRSELRALLPVAINEDQAR